MRGRVELLRIHQGRDALEVGEHHQLLPLLEAPEGNAEPILEERRCPREHALPGLGHGDDDGATIRSTSRPVHVAPLLQTSQDPRHRGAAEVHRSRERAGGYRPQAGGLLEGRQLGSRQTELVDEPPGVKVYGPHQTADRRDDAILEIESWVRLHGHRPSHTCPSHANDLVGTGHARIRPYDRFKGIQAGPIPMHSICLQSTFGA